MFDAIGFDPALAGGWPSGGAAGYRADVCGLVEAVMLETKSEPPPGEALRMLLNEMTDELKAQFGVFQKIRVEAERRLDGDDEGEIKLAKADVKSATDALSLIVRTIEKVDGLQRTLADDRVRAEEEAFDEVAYAILQADIERKIEDRARELVERRVIDAGAGPPSGA